MINLQKAIVWVLKFFFGVIVVGLLLGIANDYISPWLKGKESRIFVEFIGLCNSYWMVFSLILAIISIFWFYGWIRLREDEFRKIWEFYKPIKKLKPEDFKIQGYKKAFIPRKNDTKIDNLLKNGKYILIIGKPKIGKTRASYEAIKKLENYSVIKPRPEEIEIAKIKIPPLSNKNFILFLDDLQRFVDKNIEDIINNLKKISKKLIVVITCRTGEELNLIREEILSLQRDFTSIELEEISKDDCNRLVEDIKKEDIIFEWKVDQFDGTPGCVTLDLEDMKERYRNLGDGKIILKAIKLLNEGNLFLYKETRVKEVCRAIFEFPDKNLRRYIWDDKLINNLHENRFITMDGDIIDIYSAYLDFCVYDYEPSLNDLMKLKDILIRVRDSWSLFYLGKGFNYKNDFSHAKDCYLEALKLYPEYASAHNSLGYVLVKLGEVEESKGIYVEAGRLYEKAIGEHREAIRINHFYAVDHNNLGYALIKLGEIKEIKGEHNEATRLYEEAIGEHREAIRINPDYSSAHRSLAYALGKLGRYEEEEKEYREAIRINPDSPFTHNLLGHQLAKLGNYKEAEIEYKKAIKIKPDYPSAYNNLGYLLAKLGRVKEAENKYREAIKASPDYTVAYHNLGHLLVDLDRYKEAEGEYRRALVLNPNYAEVRNALGYLLAKLKQYDEAEKEYRRAISIKTDYVEAHTNLGYFLSYRGREDEAKREFDEVIKINPNDHKVHKQLSNIYAHRARVLTKSGEFDEAESQIREAISLNSNNALAHKNSGILKEELGDMARGKENKFRLYKEAEEKYRNALNINLKYPSAHRHLANTLAKLGINEEAETEYKKAKSVVDNYPKNNRDFGIFLSKITRIKEAERELKLAINLFKEQGNKKEAEKVRKLIKKIQDEAIIR